MIFTIRCTLDYICSWSNRWTYMYQLYISSLFRPHLSSWCILIRRWTFGMQSTFPYMYFSVIFQLTEWQSSVLCYLLNFISFLIVNQYLILCRQYPNQIIKLTSQGIFRNSRKSVNHCQQGLQNWFTSANISPQAPANLTLFSKSE